MNAVRRTTTAALVLLIALAVPAERAPAGPSSAPTQLAWSPDATRLLVAGAGGPLLQVRADGGGVRELVADDDAWYRNPRWSPDRRRVAVDRLPLRAGALQRLEIVDAADGRVVATFDGRSASWSPDGRRIAYIQSGAGSPSIAIADADGGGVRVIGRGHNPAWRPDGLAIAFERDFTVRTIGIDGTGGRRLGAGERPLWSGDGSLLAFFTADATYVVRPDGTVVRRVPASAPVAWQPGGRLALWMRDGTTAVSVDTGRSKLLSETFALPSPDGRRLAVLLDTGATEHLYAVTPGDRTARRLELDWPACVGRNGCRVGTDRADRMTGTAARDVLFPGAGADVVRSGPGDDRVDAAFGADTVEGGAGNDVLEGEPGNDRLFGGAGRDILVGHGGSDLLDGGGGSDVLDATGDGAARDTIRCGRGQDTVAADRNDFVARRLRARPPFEPRRASRR